MNNPRIQNYLDCAVLDNICLRALDVQNIDDEFYIAFRSLKKHEKPYYINVANITPETKYFENYIRIPQTNLLALHDTPQLTLKRCAGSRNIVWLQDCKQRFITQHTPSFVITCMPEPFFGDNRFIGKNIIICRYIPMTARREIIFGKLPIYYIENITKNTRLDIFNNITKHLLTNMTPENIQVLKIIRFKTNKGRLRAKHSCIFRELTKNKLNIDIVTNLVKAKVINTENNIFTINPRGYLLLYMSSSPLSPLDNDIS